MDEPEGNDYLDTHRLQLLGDGVFAIVMTLLVLELHVPELEHPATMELVWAVITLWPSFYSYFLSFVLLGAFWIGHRLQFHYIPRSNRSLLWINILFYFFISLIPFSAAFLGKYYDQQAAVVFYGANLTLAALVLYANWKYALRKNLARAVPPELQREAEKYMLFAPAIYLLAILLSFWSTTASVLIYLLTPILYIIPSRLDELLSTTGTKK